MKLKGILEENGKITIADISFKNHEDMLYCKSISGNKWDNNEIYFVADKRVKRLAESGLIIRYTRVSSCAEFWKLSNICLYLLFSAIMIIILDKKEVNKISTVKIHDMMDKTDEYFVGTCTHVNDISEHMLREEIDTFVKRRIAWLQRMYEKGSRVKVASIDGDQVGFLHIMPIEICPWGPIGRDLMVIPCLTVMGKAKGRGIGRALINSAEEEAKR